MARDHRLVFGLALLAVCGCAAPPPARTNLATQVVALSESGEELDEQLNSFVDAFQASVERIATELERKAASADERRSAILLRVRLTSACRDAAEQPDPKEVLLDLWALSQSAFDFLTRGEGKALFGERQPLAVAAARAILDDIEGLARRCVVESSYDHVRQTVLAYAAKRPMQTGFTKPAARALSDEPQGEALQSLISLPLAPLTALAGVGRTPDSIRSVAKSVDRFTDVAEDFPANARWQCQLLAMNLGELPQVADTVASVHRFADSSTTLAASSAELVRVAATMPANLRSEAEGLLERFDASQPQLQTTLSEATRTVERVSEASDRIRTSAAELTVTVDHVRDASESLERAANAVTQTAGEILKFIPASMRDGQGRLIGKPPGDSGHSVGRASGSVDAAASVRLISSDSGSPPASAALTPAANLGADAANTAKPAAVSAAPGDPAVGGGEAPGTPADTFSFQAVGRSAEALGETADKLRGLLADLRGLLDDGTLSRETGVIDGQLRGTTDLAGLRMREVVDHAAKRLAQLIALFFALLAIHVLVARRTARRCG